MKPFWVSGFVDLEPAAYDVGLAFWRDVTGWSVSGSRGETGEFVSLVPPVGDPHLLVQRLDSGGSRIHVDLHVEDPRAAADRAVALGAREVADPRPAASRSASSRTGRRSGRRPPRGPTDTPPWSTRSASTSRPSCTSARRRSGRS
jgi:hypothetical protein